MSVYDKVVELCNGHGIPQTVLEIKNFLQKNKGGIIPPIT